MSISHRPICRYFAPIFTLIGFVATGCEKPAGSPALATDVVDASSTEAAGKPLDSDPTDSANAVFDSASAASDAELPSEATASSDSKGFVDAIWAPDCAKPEAKNCPCSDLGKLCCYGLADGLTCKVAPDGKMKWVAFQDCCRDPKPGCAVHNPIPTPPWCNGQIP